MAEERTDHLRDAIHSARDSAARRGPFGGAPGASEGSAVGTPAGQGTVPLLPPHRVNRATLDGAGSTRLRFSVAFSQAVPTDNERRGGEAPLPPPSNPSPDAEGALPPCDCRQSPCFSRSRLESLSISWMRSNWPIHSAVTADKSSAPGGTIPVGHAGPSRSAAI